MRHFVMLGAMALLVGCDQSSSSAPAANQSKPAAASPTASIPASTFQPEKGYKLFHKEDFEFLPADKPEWIFRDNENVFVGYELDTYLVTKQAYDDFSLRFDVHYQTTDFYRSQWPDVASGVVVFMQEPFAIPPKGVEVDLKYLNIASLKGSGGVEISKRNDDNTNRQLFRKPVKDWNEIEIHTRKGAVTVRLNGEDVSSGWGEGIKSGRIAFHILGPPNQRASTFRNVRISTEEKSAE